MCAALCAVAYALRRVREAPWDSLLSGASRRIRILARIPVFPFENGSNMANLDWLGEGLAELTTERLEDRGLSVLARQERLAALEKIGLPDSARFSHATMVKIAGEADADAVIYGRFASDGKTITLEAHILHLSPPKLSAPFTQAGSHAGLAARACPAVLGNVVCAGKAHLSAGGFQPGRDKLFRAATIPKPGRAREFREGPHRVRR